MTEAGVWVVDKPKHLTSAEVVRRLKRWSGPGRIGHAGTLDPMATGVLPVCRGEATKLLNFMELEPKTYRGSLRFGLETDTWDITGTVVRRQPIDRLDADRLSGILGAQQGERFLRPPVYSAIKHKGKPLYAYARQGRPVATEPRRTYIHAFSLLAVRDADVEFELVCGRGTYVRAVVHDLGEQFGCGACLLSLRRLGCGAFRIEQARSLEQLERMLAEGRSAEGLLAPEELLLHLPVCSVEGEFGARVRNGCSLSGPPLDAGMGGAPMEVGQKVRILEDGRLIAVGEVRRNERGDALLQPVRVLGPWRTDGAA